MSKPLDRHPLCGGVWVGPIAWDDETVDICNECGEARAAKRSAPTSKPHKEKP